jgi:HNH endonuclease/Helix-turn-helix domain
MRNYHNIEMVLKELEYKDGEFYRNGKLLKQSKSGKGKYYRIEFKKDKVKYGAFTHNVVFALHYGLDELKKHETIDHIDGDKWNNNIENLQGMSNLDNTNKHLSGIGQSLRKKLTVEDVRIIKILLENGVTGASIARKFGVSTTCIYRIKNGKRYKNI